MQMLQTFDDKLKNYFEILPPRVTKKANMFSWNPHIITWACTCKRCNYLCMLVIVLIHIVSSSSESIKMCTHQHKHTHTDTCTRTVWEIWHECVSFINASITASNCQHACWKINNVDGYVDTGSTSNTLEHMRVFCLVISVRLPVH